MRKTNPLPDGVHHVRRGSQRGYESRGEIFVYRDGKTKRAAFHKAAERLDPLTIAIPGWNGGPDEYVSASGGRCFVGDDGTRFWFRTEAKRRAARLQAWSGIVLPKQIEPRLTDSLYLFHRPSGVVAQVACERPADFAAAIQIV